MESPFSALDTQAFATKMPAVPTASRSAGMSGVEKVQEAYAEFGWVDESCDCAGPVYMTPYIYKRENPPATLRAFDVLFVRPRLVGKGLLELIC